MFLRIRARMHIAIGLVRQRVASLRVPSPSTRPATPGKPNGIILYWWDRHWRSSADSHSSLDCSTRTEPPLPPAIRSSPRSAAARELESSKGLCRQALVWPPLPAMPASEKKNAARTPKHTQTKHGVEPPGKYPFKMAKDDMNPLVFVVSLHAPPSVKPPPPPRAAFPSAVCR
jgi:hypothetical protein